jgi:copper resistance protein D
MDIASVEFFSSKSIEAFIDHPHVLDGSLGRALAYLGLAILFGLRLWIGPLRNAVPARLLPYQLVALAAGLGGAFLVVYAALAEAVNPFSTPFSMQEVPITLADYQQMLLHTAYGNAWLAYCALLVLGVWLLRHAFPAWLTAIGGAFALAACGHSAEYGLAAPLYWVGALHLLLALVWLGGLLMIVVGRLGDMWRIEYAGLQSFSRLALPLFLLIIAMGIIRLVLQYSYEQGLSLVYVMMLVLKLVAVAGIIFSAARLRRLLKDAAAPESQYDNKLGMEIFFAALLILATALLTQLPPR